MNGDSWWTLGARGTRGTRGLKPTLQPTLQPALQPTRSAPLNPVGWASAHAPHASQGPRLLHTQSLTLHAPGTSQPLIHDLNWQVQRGERWCVLGRNGAGKSTLLRALAGLLDGKHPSPYRGHIEWLGRASTQWPAQDAARLRAYVPQHASDRFALTARRLLELAQTAAGTATPEALLQDVDAAHLIDRPVHHLSGGERQRVALAQCAAQDTPLMLIDEPVSFQDPAHQGVVSQWLCRQSDAGRALVFSAHDVNWVAQAATHVLMLLPSAQWLAGRAAEVLQAAQLEAAFGCAWREAAAGVWVRA